MMLLLLLGGLGLFWGLHWFWLPCGDQAVEATLLKVYRRQIEEMSLSVRQVRKEREAYGAAGVPAAESDRVLQAQVEALKSQVKEMQAQLLQASVVQQAQGQVAPPQQANVPQSNVPRMSPTMERQALPSDAQDWSKRPHRSPSYTELYQQLYNKEWTVADNPIRSFPNPYHKQAHMTYPHSSLWLEGDKIMDRIFKELGGADKIKFIVEAGSMHGGSAIRMAMELDKAGRRDVPILCIDPWTGDLNMWLNRIVWDHLDVRDGRATTFDQFVLNVRMAIDEGKISDHHIAPFPVSSVIGARWLQATAFTPQLVYLDSAHEIDETYYELCLYWDIVEPGGILMGDDYGWLAVRMDVDRFIADKGLTLNMFGVYYNWFIRKPGVLSGQ